MGLSDRLEGVPTNYEFTGSAQPQPLNNQNNAINSGRNGDATGNYGRFPHIVLNKIGEAIEAGRQILSKVAVSEVNRNLSRQSIDKLPGFKGKLIGKRIELEQEQVTQKQIELVQEHVNPWRRKITGENRNRWYWKNRNGRTWEEFDQSNNDILERKFSKGKQTAHFRKDEVWHHVIFASMKMQKTNFHDETEVKRSGSKPVYEELDYSGESLPLEAPFEQKDDENTCPSEDGKESKPMETNRATNRENVTMQPPLGHFVDRGRNIVPEADFFPSDDDDKKSKPGRRNRKKYSGKDKKEKKGRQNDNEHESPTDGTDTDQEQCDTETPPPNGKSVFTSPSNRSSNDQMQHRFLKEADFFPSDDDDKTPKPGRRNRKKYSGKDKKEKNGRQNDNERESPTGKRKTANLHPNGLRDDTCDPDGSDVNDYINTFPAEKESAAFPRFKTTTETVPQTSEHETDEDDQNRKKRKPRRRTDEDNSTRQASDAHGRGHAGNDHNTSDDECERDSKHLRRKRYGSVDKEEQTRTPIATVNQLPHDLDPSTEKKYLLDDVSAVHFEAHHGGFHFLHLFAQSNMENVHPLHIAASLGLKRNVSYLLQAGWDLDEKDQHGAVPVEKAVHETLVEYMKTFLPEETNPVELQQHEDSRPGEYMSVTMDRVDLSTRTVYLPSFQFRKTFEKGNHQPLLFTSPYITCYEVVCQHLVYGVLWLLGHYGRDMFTCLKDICLPDWSIQNFRSAMTGKLDVTSWLNNTERRQRHQHNQQQERSEAGTNWIKSILAGDIKEFKKEFEGGIDPLDDGWTPLHFAILRQQNDLLRFLLEKQRGNLETKTNTLLPQFILDELKHSCRFEYDYVYRHTAGFTPLLLATFTGNKDAIDILGDHITTWQLDIADCLTLAYCDDTENHLLNIMCTLGEKHVFENYNLNVKLHSVYDKDCPNKRILIGSSNDIYRRIVEDLVPVRLVLDNENIIREFLKPRKPDCSSRDTALLGRVIETHADFLWRRHSNLNAIMPGHSSSLPEEHENGEDMVVLHCSHKGFIHTRELPFKKYLHKDGERIRVHVIQGSFRFGPLESSNQPVQDFGRERRKIKVGYKIKDKPSNMMATLGVMVEDLDGNIGILTCAHMFLNEFLKKKDSHSYDKLYDQNDLQVDVFLRKPELLVHGKKITDQGQAASNTRGNAAQEDMEWHEMESSPRGNAAQEDMEWHEMESSPSGNAAQEDMEWQETESSQSSDSDCARAEGEQTQRCGYLRRVIFKTDTVVAIDVALIMFHSNSIECSPALYFFAKDRDNRKMQLQRIDKDCRKKDLEFASGKIFKQTDKQHDEGYKVMKCGLTTDLSVGTLAYSDNNPSAQVKVTDDQCHCDGFILKGQFIVEPTIGHAFFEKGDSGSAVFVKTGNGFECLGLAIGGISSSNETLVTPIESVLCALNEQPQGASRMQQYRLKKIV